MVWSNIDHFEGEDCLVTIEQEGKDTVTNIQTKISNIEVGGGAENTEDIFLFGGATINFQKPREKYTIKFEFVTTDTTFSQINFGGTGGAGAELRSSDTAKKFRIILWFVPAANQLSTGSVTVPPATADIRRMIFVDCKSVELTSSITAGEVLKGSISFEFSATDADGYANYFDEYVNSTTSTLTVLTTTAHRGLLTWSVTTTRAWTGSYRT